MAVTDRTDALVPDPPRGVSATILAVLRQLSRGEWLLIGVVFFCYVYVISPANTNSISRYDMIYALAHGTAIIDVHASNTIDVSVYHGHYYSPRSIGLSLVAVPVFYVIRAITDATHTHPTLTEQIGYMSMFTLLPVALMGVIAFERFLLHIRPAWKGTRWPLVTTAAFALGTLFFPFSTVFFSHAFGGGLVFTGFYLLFRARERDQSQRDRHALIAGLFVGLGIISEYPTGLVMLVLAAYVWLTYGEGRLRSLFMFAIGMAPWALVLGWYNWFAFGDPLHMSYEYVAGSQFKGQHRGFFGVTWPHPGAIWEVLVYPRGLLVESPFLLLIPLGFYRWIRSGHMRAEAYAAIAVTIPYIAFVASYFLPMAGENLPGPRLLVPMLPFACLALSWVLDDHRMWLRAALAAAIGFGIAISTLWVLLGVREYHTYTTYPVHQLFSPVIKTGYVPHLNGPTPPNLGTLLLGLPRGVSTWLMLVPVALFIAWTVVTIVRSASPQSSRPTPADGRIAYTES